MGKVGKPWNLAEDIMLSERRKGVRSTKAKETLIGAEITHCIPISMTLSACVELWHLSCNMLEPLPHLC